MNDIDNITQKKLVIAIDGHSSCGKSTLAKDLAKQLQYIYIDSGAMYRAVSLYFLENNLEITNSKDYTDLLIENVRIAFINAEGTMNTLLNNRNVESEIRKPSIADIVSHIAANPSIRRFLVKQQRDLGRKKGVVMDGRDIGSVVFPNAEIKFFVTADVDIRTKRRFEELTQKGITTTLKEVKINLEKRDFIDSTRDDSPLVKVKDAILIDTSSHTRSSQIDEAMEHIMSALKI